MRTDRSRSARFIRRATICLAAACVASAVAVTQVAAHAVALPPDNLIVNPSFESTLAPWDGTALTRVPLTGAPDGSYVARVATVAGRISIDNWPGSVTATTAGSTYLGSASVAAATSAAVGKPISLTVREHTAAGATIASWSSPPVALTTAFQVLTLSGIAHASGDYVDIYAHEENAAATDGFYADAFSLTARAPMPVTNEEANPSFEQNLAPWGVNHGTFAQIRSANAPDGAYVAQMTYAGSGSYMSLDDWPGATTTQAGQRYEGSVLVAAANTGTVCRQVYLMVREHAPDGSYVTEFDSPAISLQRNFQRLVVDGNATRTGDLLDVVVVDAAPITGDTIWVDAVSVASVSSTIAELAIGTGQADHLGDTSKYQYVIIQDYEHADVAAVKQANPNTKVFAYLDAATVQKKSCTDPNPPAYSPHDSYGVNYCYVQKYHPEWFLTDSNGSRLTYSGYPNNTVVDIGQTAYRSLWASNAAAAAQADGFDGLFMDDVNTHPSYGLDGKVAQYTDQAYGQAMVGMVHDVTSALSAHGLLSIANVGADPWVGWQADDAATMGTYLTATNREFFTRFGYGPFSTRFSDPASNGNPPLSTILAFQSRLLTEGARTTEIDYGATPTNSDDLLTMSYGRAAFLLTWDGRPGSAYIFRPAGTVDPADPAWTTELGLPVGPVTTIGGASVRSYTNGIVVLDPSPTATATVPLDGTFITPTGQVITGNATVQPQTALLLTRTSYG